jgi:hypothetical protein
MYKSLVGPCSCTRKKGLVMAFVLCLRVYQIVGVVLTYHDGRGQGSSACQIIAVCYLHARLKAIYLATWCHIGVRAIDFAFLVFGKVAW